MTKKQVPSSSLVTNFCNRWNDTGANLRSIRARFVLTVTRTWLYERYFTSMGGFSASYLCIDTLVSEMDANQDLAKEFMASVGVDVYYLMYGWHHRSLKDVFDFIRSAFLEAVIEGTSLGSVADVTRCLSAIMNCSIVEVAEQLGDWASIPQVFGSDADKVLSEMMDRVP